MFKSISRKLGDKANCIEELSEMREWCKTIPDIIAEHSVSLLKNIKHNYFSVMYILEDF